MTILPQSPDPVIYWATNHHRNTVLARLSPYATQAI